MSIPAPSVFRAEPGPLSGGTAAFPFDPPEHGPSGEWRWHDLVYSCPPGFRPLMLDLRVPDGPTPAPVVVWIHGGGWLQGSRRRRAPNLHAHRVVERIVETGFAVALIDYRLAAEAPFPAALLDVRAAIRWLRAQAGPFGLDPARIVLWGESAGAHLGAMAAFCRLQGARTGEFLEQSEEVTALVDWYGPADLSALSFDPALDSDEQVVANPLRLLTEGTDWSLADLSPVRHVRAGLPPVFIAHGRDDRQVPVAQSRALHRTLLEAGSDVEYLETPGDHVFTGADVLPGVIDRSIDFLRRRCATARAAAAPGAG